MEYDVIKILVDALLVSWETRDSAVRTHQQELADIPPENIIWIQEYKDTISELQAELEGVSRVQALLQHMTVCGTEKSFIDVYLERQKGEGKRE